MIANLADAQTQFGNLAKNIHLPGTSLYELLDFIAGELPRWRDRIDRPNKTSEPALTSQLCAHLNSAARLSDGWDFLQFRIEEPDEQHAGRKIDLVPAPSGATVWIEGRRHVDFDSLMPIECKRLPTPLGKDRDEREYVFNQKASTGGIQRFKDGHHGAAHLLGGMIAYIQEETSVIWDRRIAEWIKQMVESGQLGWSLGDLLHLKHDDEIQKICVLQSKHTRANNLRDIELRHLWLTMN